MIKYFLIAILLIGCGNEDSNSKEQFPNSKEGNETLIHNLNKIGKIINLSKVIVDTANNPCLGIYRMGLNNNEWVPGPSDYYLVSTLKAKFIDTVGFGKAVVLKSPLEKNKFNFKSWLPYNVKKELFDKNTFKELSMYSAKVFLKEGLHDGFFIILSDSTIYLHMTDLAGHSVQPDSTK